MKTEASKQVADFYYNNFYISVREDNTSYIHPPRNPETGIYPKGVRLETSSRDAIKLYIDLMY